MSFLFEILDLCEQIKNHCVNRCIANFIKLFDHYFQQLAKKLSENQNSGNINDQILPNNTVDVSSVAVNENHAKFLQIREEIIQDFQDYFQNHFQSKIESYLSDENNSNRFLQTSKNKLMKKMKKGAIMDAKHFSQQLTEITQDLQKEVDLKKQLLIETQEEVARMHEVCKLTRQRACKVIVLFLLFF